jgi:hypothetical protein
MRLLHFMIFGIIIFAIEYCLFLTLGLKEIEVFFFCFLTALGGASLIVF